MRVRRSHCGILERANHDTRRADRQKGRAAYCFVNVLVRLYTLLQVPHAPRRIRVSEVDVRLQMRKRHYI